VAGRRLLTITTCWGECESGVMGKGEVRGAGLVLVAEKSRETHSAAV
jgi:hypothetical protein